MKPFQDLDIWSQQIEQYTIYHHQSMLNREGTVNSQRACYFHEPFNVASKDISIIYHSEASQKTLFGERMLKTPVCFPFSPSKSEAKSQINLFFFFWGLFEEEFGDLNLLMGKSISAARTHRLLWFKQSVFFSPHQFCFSHCCLFRSLLFIYLFIFCLTQSINPFSRP